MNDNRKTPQDDRDDVASLLRLAGKRDAVPPERAERVRVAARARWKQEVRGRSRRRLLAGAAGLAAAAALVIAVGLWVRPGSSGPAGPDRTTRVEVLNGPAWARAGGAESDLVPLEIGGEVRPGTEVTTAGDGRAALRLATGHSVRLDRSTTLRILEDRTLALDQGAVYVDSGVTPAGWGPLEIRTSLGLVREIGTQYEVRLAGDDVLLRLREGAAVLRRDGDAHEVRVGTELRMTADGAATRRAIRKNGPEWAWTADVTPVPDIEGLTAEAFLRWAARERGLFLVYLDEDAERAAVETKLSGTIQGLTLEEALGAVLPTCRMTYSIGEDALAVAVAVEPE
jgi:ferric-dicitrate binding protein FerR (iron transport regulator)